MALPTPSTATEVVNRAKTDVVRKLEGGNPFLRNSWLGALISGYANRVFDFYYTLTQAEKESLPDTAIINRPRWASIYKIIRTAATKADGNVVFYGSALTEPDIPIDTVVVASDGKEYETTQAAALPGVAIQINIATLTRIGTTCTATMTSAHGLASGTKLIVLGALPIEYNTGSWVPIMVISATQFTYEVDVAPASSPATGSPYSLSIFVSVPVKSIEFGDDQNQVAGTILTLQSPIADVVDEAGVDWDAIGNGTDQETSEAQHVRTLDRIQNPVANFNANQIRAKAKSIAGVTRVSVQEITPTVGQVTIYFMRDNDANSIPDGSEVAVVQAAMEDIRPATSDPTDVIVTAPVAEPTDFTFTDLQPNTASMKEAVEDNLELFFADRDEESMIGVDIDSDAYRSAIFNTVDTTNGDIVTSFTLSGPVGDIVIAAGKTGTLGNVVFP